MFIDFSFADAVVHPRVIVEKCVVLAFPGELLKSVQGLSHQYADDARTCLLVFSRRLLPCYCRGMTSLLAWGASQLGDLVEDECAVPALLATGLVQPVLIAFERDYLTPVQLNHAIRQVIERHIQRCRWCFREMFHAVVDECRENSELVCGSASSRLDDPDNSLSQH
ncbi:hypothetical protein A5708_19265 [Mycobacterium colombiense]|uniref:Uncharacterized protein n=1 Tax=Mycobacterium colombiense TaxID=339268 RepID=A0A1A2Z1D3_9MYCO|nr:hypothetical protein A5708_19265 [Mycobacterium colombiense]